MIIKNIQKTSGQQEERNAKFSYVMDFVELAISRKLERFATFVNSVFTLSGMRRPPRQEIVTV